MIVKRASSILKTVVSALRFQAAVKAHCKGNDLKAIGLMKSTHLRGESLLRFSLFKAKVLHTLQRYRKAEAFYQQALEVLSENEAKIRKQNVDYYTLYSEVFLEVSENMGNGLLTMPNKQKIEQLRTLECDREVSDLFPVD